MTLAVRAEMQLEHSVALARNHRERRSDCEPTPRHDVLGQNVPQLESPQKVPRFIGEAQEFAAAPCISSQPLRAFPSQSEVPEAQGVIEATQTPAVHTVPVAQRWPQAPQFVREELTSTHSAPHIRSGAAHVVVDEHAPLTHRCTS